MVGEEGNVLFNNILNTFYLRLYGAGHMVTDHSEILIEETDSQQGIFYMHKIHRQEHIPQPSLHQL